MDEYIAGPKQLADGHCGWVVPLTFDRARVVVGPCEATWLEDGW